MENTHYLPKKTMQKGSSFLKVIFFGVVFGCILLYFDIGHSYSYKNHVDGTVLDSATGARLTGVNVTAKIYFLLPEDQQEVVGTDITSSSGYFWINLTDIYICKLEFTKDCYEPYSVITNGQYDSPLNVNLTKVEGDCETVSLPTIPSGPINGTPGTSYTYSTGGSISNSDHSLQYLFDWGDDTNSGWLPVGTLSATKSWTVAGTYSVRAQARCSSHDYVVSSWSGTLSVNISISSSVPSGYWTDFDGDGATDVAAFHLPTDQFFTDYAGNLGQFGWGGSDSMPLIWDYDGDGKTDVSIYHIPTNQWFVKGVGNLGQFGWGGEESVPVPGDYNGDGRMERAFYHSPTNRWFVEGQDSVQFGWNGEECIPVPGDYDGDGKTDMVIYHIPTNQWFLYGVGNLGQFGWGGSDCIPVPGDYNGDGKMERGFYRPGSNQ
jgi:hypothetical protein